MKTIYFCHSGPMVRYGGGSLCIDDLNPERHMTWRMSRLQMLRVGWRCFVASLTSN